VPVSNRDPACEAGYKGSDSIVLKSIFAYLIFRRVHVEHQFTRSAARLAGNITHFDHAEFRRHATLLSLFWPSQVSRSCACSPRSIAASIPIAV
jgi:hypothetical protein